MLQSPSAPAVDGALAVGRLALQLSRTGAAGLPEALAGLLETGLRSIVLRAAPQDGEAGALLAVAGEVVHAVPVSRTGPVGPVVELPLCGPGGVALGTLTVVGARPALLPALRAAAAVVALTLLATAAPDDEHQPQVELLEDAETALGAFADLLHDGVVQDLVVARYAADGAARGGDPALVRDAVQQALVGLRRSLWHLRPRGDAGLPQALKALSGRLAESGRRPLELTLAGDVDVLDPASATTAYRLVQALALALDPGDPPLPVAVRRSPAPGGRSVVVLDAPAGACHDALARFRRRAQTHGGELTVAGGRVRLVLPAPGAVLRPLPVQGRPVPGRAVPGHPAPAPPVPGHPAPGHPAPGHPAPGRPPTAKAPT